MLAGFRQGSSRRAGCGRHTAPGEDRAAAQPLGVGPAGRSRARFCCVARLASMRTPTPRPWARRPRGDAGTSPSPSSGHRSSSPPSPSPSLGGSRFRMAEPVIISYARGLLNDFGLRIVDVIPVDLVAAALCGGGGRASGRARGGAGGVRVGEPSALPQPRRPGVGLVHRAPALRLTGPADRRARWSFPGRGRVQAQLCGPARPWIERSGCSRASRCGKAGRAERPYRGEARASGSSARLRGALRRLCRVRGRLPRTSCSRWEALDEADQELFGFDPGSSAGPTTSATSTCRPSSSRPGCAPNRERRQVEPRGATPSRC